MVVLYYRRFNLIFKKGHKMTNEEHERELQRLYTLALKQGDFEVSMDILGQLHHFGYSLPTGEKPSEVPELTPESPMSG